MDQIGPWKENDLSAFSGHWNCNYRSDVHQALSHSVNLSDQETVEYITASCWLLLHAFIH